MVIFCVISELFSSLGGKVKIPAKNPTAKIIIKIHIGIFFHLFAITPVTSGLTNTAVNRNKIPLNIPPFVINDTIASNNKKMDKIQNTLSSELPHMLLYLTYAVHLYLPDN